MQEKIKCLFLYGGVRKEEYEKIRPMIDESNRKTVIALSGIATLLISFMLMSSTKVDGVSMNKIVYTAGAIISPMILFIALFYAKERRKTVCLLVSVAYSVYYIYGILIGAILDPADKTVTLMVLLVLLPTIFIDRPVHITLITSAYVFVFIGFCFRNKTGGTLENDLLDVIVFSILGITAGTFINCRTVRGFLNLVKNEELLKEKEELLEELKKALKERDEALKEKEEFLEELEKVGKEDKLTGMKNRNAYELELYEIPRIMQNTLGCVYIDVNGLKRLNDDYGHSRGDEMLVYVAQKIKEYFGDELAYRIGGDEFIVFIPDPGDNVIGSKVEEMSVDFEKKNYYISAGWSYYDKIGGHLSLKWLIEAAENRMREKKIKFHMEHPEFDRRTKRTTS